MRAALHPDLAKRGLDYADGRPSGVHHLTADYMERSAAKGPRPQFARTCQVLGNGELATNRTKL